MEPTIESKPGQISAALPVAAQNSALAYGLGSFGLYTLSTVFSGYSAFYYTDVLGLAVSMAAIIRIIYTVWDALNDPLVGFLSDNTRTRWGRRKPWLLAGLPLFMGILILVYAVPQPFHQGNALFWYALVIFFLFDGVYTIMSVNYAALFPELFQGLRERARASSTYQGLSLFGQLIGFSLPPLIYAKYGFVPMAVSFALVAGFASFLGVINNKEDPNALNAPRLDLKGAFGEVLRDRPFLWFAIAVTFLMYITGVYTWATPFWVKYTLAASPQVTSLIYAIVFIASILSVSIWGRLVRILGLKRTWLVAVGMGVVSALLMGFASSLVVGAIGAAVIGASMGGIQVCRVIIMANFMDQNQKRTGHRQEGIYTSLLRVTGKLSMILDSLALVLLSLLFGYVSGENPGLQPGNAFRFVMGGFPLVFTLLSWLIASRLSFDTKPAET